MRWRALSLEALGHREKAIEDAMESLRVVEQMRERLAPEDLLKRGATRSTLEAKGGVMTGRYAGAQCVNSEKSRDTARSTPTATRTRIWTCSPSRIASSCVGRKCGDQTEPRSHRRDA